MSNTERSTLETTDDTSDSTPQTLVNQPAAFELGLCTTEEVLTLEKQVELTADLEQLPCERRLASTALQFMHS